MSNFVLLRSIQNYLDLIAILFLQNYPSTQQKIVENPYSSVGCTRILVMALQGNGP